MTLAASAFLYRRPRLRLGLLLSAPLLWLGLAYLGALAALFVTAFWSTDGFTGQVVREWSLGNFHTLFTDAVYRAVTLRTMGIAALVTVVDAVIAFPMAYAMARVVPPRARPWLVIAVLTPLWASYLVKAYAWRAMLSGEGVLHWLLAPLGLDTPGYGLPAVVITLAYLWLPYMILPVYAGLDRLPSSLLDAAADLGARPARAFRSVILPLTLPAVVAGSIFTFSLSLGDYITVQIVGGTSQMLGNVVFSNIGAANNLPFAATVALVPVVIMLAYLAAARRVGALEQL
ncbi:ABC transporter permease [Pseudonocardia eucalypti]|uniref:ABC transporter permease n=1 Tax=Pseudonocardia eucalypti TaxID=648755 RepID=A0ABP9Q6M0_9PSEU|nr:putative spermidine/putrescine transport system permease protein [Pseudonocardia eucalypti]